MLVAIDRYIPGLGEALEPYADVRLLTPEEITPDTVGDADALIIRTRTRCNSALLEGSRVQFIATATIGYDHIDTDYCAKRHIEWTSCPGCNAAAVCDYVTEAIREYIRSGARPRSIGILGVGHVGSLVAAAARQMGLETLVYDPPLGLHDDVSGADILTLHTPLTRNGAYPTYHLIDRDMLQRCRPDALIINAARGGVVDEQALLNSTQPYVLDCWEGEPDINRELCLNQRAFLTSYHIAGYSLQGKINASQMCLDAFCAHFGLPPCTIKKNVVPLQGDSSSGWLKRVSLQLKADPQAFEQLRQTYRLR